MRNSAYGSAMAKVISADQKVVSARKRARNAGARLSSSRPRHLAARAAQTVPTAANAGKGEEGDRRLRRHRRAGERARQNEIPRPLPLRPPHKARARQPSRKTSPTYPSRRSALIGYVARRRRAATRRDSHRRGHSGGQAHRRAAPCRHRAAPRAPAQRARCGHNPSTACR